MIGVHQVTTEQSCRDFNVPPTTRPIGQAAYQAVPLCFSTQRRRTYLGGDTGIVEADHGQIRKAHSPRNSLDPPRAAREHFTAWGKARHPFAGVPALRALAPPNRPSPIRLASRTSFMSLVSSAAQAGSPAFVLLTILAGRLGAVPGFVDDLPGSGALPERSAGDCLLTSRPR
jgi:hypothetical protein